MAKTHAPQYTTELNPEGLLPREVTDKETWLVTGYDDDHNFVPRAVVGRHAALDKCRELVKTTRIHVSDRVQQLVEGRPAPYNTPCEFRVGYTSVQMVRIIGANDREF